MSSFRLSIPFLAGFMLFGCTPTDPAQGPTEAEDLAAIRQAGDQLIAARCILPLSQARYPGRALGTRHRAALGLSQESDAVVVVVSEETGRISIASDGQLTRMKDAAELRSYLSEVLRSHEKPDRSTGWRDILGRSGIPGLTR